jgi:hypothetical protein
METTRRGFFGLVAGAVAGASGLAKMALPSRYNPLMQWTEYGFGLRVTDEQFHDRLQGTACSDCNYITGARCANCLNGGRA